MKKFALVFITIFAVAFIFVGCSRKNEKIASTKTANITINKNLENACTYEVKETYIGQTLKFEIIPNIGYTCLGYYVNEEFYEGSICEITNIQDNTKIDIVCDYATYEIGVCEINTTESITSKDEYVEMNFSLLNVESEQKNLTGGIRLRGNSTLRYDKKAYRIKLDKKASLFGHKKAKSWVLLADYLDPSCLHNYFALTLGNELDKFKFTPTPHKVNLYLNGEYKGLYTFCEQVQENEGRIDIEKDITGEETSLFDYNFFVTMDESCIKDTGAEENKTYIKIAGYNKIFELKYPEYSDFKSDEKFEQYITELKAFLTEVLDKMQQKDTTYIESKLDINSLIDFLLVDQIMGEMDHSYKSFNMFYDSSVGKLSFGPIWDYDWCLYTDWTGNPNVDYDIENANRVSYSNYFYQYLMDIPEFAQRVKNRYNNTVADILESMIGAYDSYISSIENSLVLNNALWYSKYNNITVNNINYFKNYLIARKQHLDNRFA